MLASQKGHIEIVRLLLEKGANVNVKNFDGYTALILALNNVHIVKLLIEAGADINCKDRFEGTALMYASQNGHVEIVKLLLERGANVNIKNIIEGHAALALALNNLHIAKLLIEAGADINCKDTFGHTALMLASKKGHKEVAELLINYGANINDKDNIGYTALMHASKNAHKEIVKLLVEKGANTDNVSSNVVEETLIENIKNNKIEKSLALIHKYNNKINFNIKDNKGNTFLHYSSLVNNTELFDIFLLHKVNKNAMNIRKETPLYSALCKNNFDEKFIWYLINKGAILNPTSYVRGKVLVDILLPYEGLCNKLVYEPLTAKLLGTTNTNYNIKCKVKKIIKILKLKDDDFHINKGMITFIRRILLNNINNDNINNNNMYANNAFEVNLRDINIENDNNEDMELNIEVFDEIFRHFREEDYWDSIRNKGIDVVKRNFKDKLDIIKGYKPVNKSIFEMNKDERLKHTNFQRKKKLAKLLRLISRVSENGYNNDKIKFVVNQILDVVVCSEGSLEVINDSIRYLSGEENSELKDIINEELIYLRYNILKEVCSNRIKIRINGREEVIEITPHTFPQLVKEMSEDLKLKIEYLDEIDYQLVYNKNEIVEIVLKKYKYSIVRHIKDKINESGNEMLWNKVRDYIERDIFKGRKVLEISNFLYDEAYKIKEEAVKALLFHLDFLK